MPLSINCAVTSIQALFTASAIPCGVAVETPTVCVTVEESPVPILRSKAVPELRVWFYSKSRPHRVHSNLSSGSLATAEIEMLWVPLDAFESLSTERTVGCLLETVKVLKSDWSFNASAADFMVSSALQQRRAHPEPSFRAILKSIRD